MLQARRMEPRCSTPLSKMYIHHETVRDVICSTEQTPWCARCHILCPLDLAVWLLDVAGGSYEQN